MAFLCETKCAQTGKRTKVNRNSCLPYKQVNANFTFCRLASHRPGPVSARLFIPVAPPTQRAVVKMRLSLTCMSTMLIQTRSHFTASITIHMHISSTKVTKGQCASTAKRKVTAQLGASETNERNVSGT